MIEGGWQAAAGSISGWARNSDNPHPVWVELLADDEVIGIGRADLPEPDNCGFWLPVPAALSGEDCVLQVRVANTDILLQETAGIAQPGNEPLILEPDESDLVQSRGLAGELNVDRGLTISGWVRDMDRPEEKLAVHALVGDVEVAETVAAERRYRPLQADGHGFSLELPQEFADGRSYTISILDDRKRHVPGSPFRIRSLPKNAALWLESQKKVEKPTLSLIQGLLENMEERLPGAMAISNFQNWKKAFPVIAPGGRQKAAYGLVAGTEQDPARKQQGIELRRNDAKADFLISAYPGTQLHPYALAQMYRQMQEHEAGIVYADSENQKGEPQFKTCWDSEAFFAGDYLGAFIVTPEVVARAGLAPGDSRELVRLKLVMAAKDKILHVPMLLSLDGEEPEEIARLDAVQTWLNLHRPGAVLRQSGVAWPLAGKPPVSILIPTRDQADLLRTCLASLEQTDWPDYEILIIDNGSTEPEALEVLANAAKKANVRILELPGVFNYARLNNEAARQAKGDLLCFLNNDTEALHPEWLTELARPLLAAGEEGGASGAKLLWPNGLVQHGGVIIGIHQLAAHAGNRWLEDEPGYMGRNQIVQQFSAVTAACMLTPRKLFIENGGFDERRFPVAFNDVDYCLRLRAKGKKIFWTPESRLAHHESASRGRDTLPSAKARADREMNYFRQIWGHYEDPFYNPNLSLSALCEPFHGLAFPPRPREAR